MNTLAIVPAVTMMFPALLPFFLTLAFLFVLSRRSGASGRTDSPRTALFPDMVVVGGILLLFGLFDPPSLTRFYNPFRPMDWIPDLILAGFLLRTFLLPRFPVATGEIPSIAAGILILLLPILRQRSFTGALTLYAEILALWISIRLLIPREGKQRGTTLILLPAFMTSATFGVVSPLTGSLLLGQIGGGLAAIIAAIFLVSLFRAIRVSTGEIALATGSLLLVGSFYAEIPLPIMGGLLGGVVAGSLGLRIPAGKFHRGRVFVVFVLSAIPLGLALLQAIKQVQSSGGGY